MNKITFILVFLFGFSLQFGCKSTQKLYENGQYTKVFNSLSGKASKGKLSADEQTIFLKSIDDWSKDQSITLDENLASKDVKIWESGLVELKKIKKFQSKFNDYPQIRNKDFAQLDIPAYQEEFHLRLYDYHQYFFNGFFEKFDANQDKKEILRAYNELEQMRQYSDDVQYLDSLESVCIDLGHRNIVVDIDNRTIGNNYEFSTSFNNRITFYDDKWTSYHKILADSLIDYEVTIELTDLDEDRRQVDRVQSYREEIIDGYETQVDTAGRTSQVPIYRTVTAQVSEVGFVFLIRSQATVEIYNPVTRRSEFDEYYRDETYEELVRNYLLSGDNRAVPRSIRLENGGYNPYNVNYDYGDLIEDSLEKLADRIESEVRQF